MQIKQPRVIVADIGDAFATVCADHLRQAGYWAVTRRQLADEMLASFRTEHPDEVIFNMSVLSMDVPGFVRKMTAISDVRCVAFFASENPYLERMLEELGVICLMLPDSPDVLCELVDQHCSLMQETAGKPLSETAVTLEITELLHSCCVPVHLNGFHYLRSAILLSCCCPAAKINSITALYRDVANHYKVSVSQVERGIRNAIGQAWQLCAPAEKLPPYSFFRLPTVPKQKPTNSEFVAFASDWIRLRSNRSCLPERSAV